MAVAPPCASVLERFVEATDAHPDSAAIVAGDVTLSYEQLAARADHLAARLSALGVEPGDLVGLTIARSPALIVAALGILRAGAAYVATDTAYPDARLRWLLDDAAVTVTVADADTAARLGSQPTVIVSATGELLDQDDAEVPSPASVATETAYVIYTSGSTGEPKGVVVDHASLSNLVEWHCTQFELSAGDRTTQLSSPGFDASVWEIWPALAAGATLDIVPEPLRTDPAGLRDWLVARAITHTFVPTPVAETLIGLPWPQDGTLRYLLTGGDALGRRPRAGLPFTVVNNYGLSETTVVATSGAVDPDGEGPPSIGRAITGVVAEVVDEQLRPVPDGDSGELIVGGVAVARGYLHAEDPSQARFLAGADGRRYRTGDRVRRLADGTLEFLGRIDDQLSIRGVRVEPAEVVTALTAHAAVGAAAVTAVGESSGARRLVAHLVSAGGEIPPSPELDGFLAARLPAAFVPSDYVWHDSLPLTAHGKLDRAALAGGASHEDAAPAPPPSAERTVEQRIAAVAAELLGVAEIATEENFFLLGGHSMLGAQLIARLDDMFGAEVTLRFLFDHPTAAQLAREVDRQAQADDRVTTALR